VLAGTTGDEQGGAILPIFAILLVVLIGLAGFAVDLGWIYVKSLEVQHGADIAALAGVVYEPTQRPEAHTEAMAAAAENGFVDGSMGGSDTVLIEDFVDNPLAVENPSQLSATVTQTVPTFFMQLFGISDIDLTRTAVAQYIQPLAMGSPGNTFGNDVSTGDEPGFWGSIHGTYGPQSWGDRYAALCLGTGGFANPGCTKTEEGRPSVAPGGGNATGGYVYGIEVAPGSNGLDVQIFDGPYYHYEDEVTTPGDHAALYFTGDYGDPTLGNPMATTWFMLYGPDSTPLDTSDNPLLCSVRYAARDSRLEDYPWWDETWTTYDEVDPSLLAQMWDSMATSVDRFGSCASLDQGAGIYPLRVMVEANDGWWTTNKYSLRATTTSGPQPHVYGLGDMSISTNIEVPVPPGYGTTTFYVARIDERYADKTLIVELWDPGDVDKIGPSDNITIFSASGAAISCDWTASNGNSGASCSIPVAGDAYNNKLITVTIPIPDDYTCSGDGCWFKVTYSYTGADVHDTTTWTAYIAGNPIRLVK
jgi:Putative Flp pilus-assembly TadE/G-like